MRSGCDHIENPRDDLCLSFIPHTGPGTPGYKFFDTGMWGGSGFRQEQGHGNTSSLPCDTPGVPFDPNILVEKDETKWLEIEFASPQGLTPPVIIVKRANGFDFPR